MPKSDKPVGIVCSDLHLSHKAPILRSEEDSWYSAMYRVLSEVSGLSQKYDCPVYFAGDLFDTWRAPAELINFALEQLPAIMFCIPGQHDLPFHRNDDLHKSAYYTLWLKHFQPLSESPVTLSAVPYGAKQRPAENFLALVHQYCWIRGSEFPGASEDNHATRLVDRMKGHRVIAVGDNHKGFEVQTGGSLIYNCGCMMRRSVKELEYTPSVGLLYPSGLVKRVPLDTKHDIYLSGQPLQTAKQAEEITAKAFDLIEQLKQLGQDSYDFTALVKQLVEKQGCNNKVKYLLDQIIDEIQDEETRS